MCSLSALLVLLLVALLLFLLAVILLLRIANLFLLLLFLGSSLLCFSFSHQALKVFLLGVVLIIGTHLLELRLLRLALTIAVGDKLSCGLLFILLFRHLDGGLVFGLTLGFHQVDGFLILRV